MVLFGEIRFSPWVVQTSFWDFPLLLRGNPPFSSPESLQRQTQPGTSNSNQNNSISRTWKSL